MSKGKTFLSHLLLLSIFILTGCATSPPSNINSLCKIFEEKRGWYKDTKKSFKKHGIPIHVQMAIIYQESSFKAKAKPGRVKFLGFIPLWRKSSAYGYAQVKDETWKWYKKRTGRGGADRDDFGDATDFVGWYGNITHKQLGVSKWNAKDQYLAYHEGHGGYKRKSYLKKKWLLRVSSKVNAKALQYSKQLKKCRDKLEKGFDFWPFW